MANINMIQKEYMLLTIISCMYPAGYSIAKAVDMYSSTLMNEPSADERRARIPDNPGDDIEWKGGMTTSSLS
jgi:hypothetical protein